MTAENHNQISTHDMIQLVDGRTDAARKKAVLAAIEASPELQQRYDEVLSVVVELALQEMSAATVPDDDVEFFPVVFDKHQGNSFLKPSRFELSGWRSPSFRGEVLTNMRKTLELPDGVTVNLELNASEEKGRDLKPRADLSVRTTADEQSFVLTSWIDDSGEPVIDERSAAKEERFGKLEPGLHELVIRGADKRLLYQLSLDLSEAE